MVVWAGECATFKGPHVFQITWAADGGRIMSSEDHTVRVWDLANDFDCRFP